MKQCWAGGLFVLALFAFPASSAAAQGQQSSRDPHWFGTQTELSESVQPGDAHRVFRRRFSELY